MIGPGSDKNQNKTHFEEGMHFMLSGHHNSSHICNQICHKKIVSKFSKNEGEGRGQRPYEIFPKIHSIW